MIELVADAKAIDFNSLRFLVVDDDRDQRYLLSRTLAGMGTGARRRGAVGTRGARPPGSCRARGRHRRDRSPDAGDGRHGARPPHRRAQASRGRDPRQRARRRSAGLRGHDGAGLRRARHRHDREAGDASEVLFGAGPFPRPGGRDARPRPASSSRRRRTTSSAESPPVRSSRSSRRSSSSGAARWSAPKRWHDGGIRREASSGRTYSCRRWRAPGTSTSCRGSCCRCRRWRRAAGAAPI